MKLLRRVLVGLLVLCAILLVIGMMLPRPARVERSVTIHTRPELVFPLVATMKRWPEWTAWTTNRFPDMTLRFDGPDFGVGAMMVANGKSSGDGKVRIKRAEPTNGIAYELDFNHGMQIFQCAITFVPHGANLKVVWSYEAELGWNPLRRTQHRD